jgi:hypothetical protein
MMLYLIIFHALSVWELRHVKMPYSIPILTKLPVAALADSYCVFLPQRGASLGRKHAGRNGTRLDFPDAARPWLSCLLGRFMKERQQLLGDPKSDYLFVSGSRNRHDAPVSSWHVWNRLKQATKEMIGAECSPNMLRKTVAVLVADQSGSGILGWMGWSPQQAFAYTWAPRETVTPQSGESANTKIGAIEFPKVLLS